MKNPRVLITTYQSAFLRPGGGEAELKNLVYLLKKVGVQSEIYGSSSSSIGAYDVILHFSVFQESFDFLKQLKDLGKPIILWPNLWWVEEPSAAILDSVKSFFELSDMLLFKSKAELSNVAQYISLDEFRHEVVGWHIDDRYLVDVDESVFKKIYSLDHFILWVGIIERGKNQLSAIKALYNLNVPMVFIGSHRDEAYFFECQEAASDSTLFLPYMAPGSDILRAAYKGCAAYIELSYEPAGLSALEAALYEKPMILGEAQWSTEKFGEGIAKVDPTSNSEILDAVLKALAGEYRFSNSKLIFKNHVHLDSLKPLERIINNLYLRLD